MSRRQSFLRGTGEQGDPPPDPLMAAGFGTSLYPPGESFRQHLNQATPQPGAMENVQALAQSVRDRPNFSVAPSSNDDDDIDDFGGGDFAPSAPAQANPFAPSGPLPVGPQPTAHAESPPEQQVGPPPQPEYNPLAGLPAPYVPPYARPGAQPTPGPGSPEYMAQYATPDAGPQSEQPGRGALAGPSVLSPQQMEALAVQQNAQNMTAVPPDIQEAQQMAAEREAGNYGDPGVTGPPPNPNPPSSSSLDDLLYSPPGSTLGGPNPWDRTTPPPEPEPEDEGGGSWWDWAPGDFDLDSVPQRALNVITGAGNVDQTIQNAVDPRVAPVPESEELDYAGGAANEMGEWAQEQVDTARWIASDPIGAGTYLGNPHNWDEMVEQTIQNYRENPEDIGWDIGLGAVTSAATGAATAGAGGLIYRGLNRLGVPDVPASVPGAASSVVRGASGVPDVNAPSPAAGASPGVARLMDEATSATPAAPAVARNVGAPDVSGPQYQLPTAPVRTAAGAPDVSGPQYQLPDVPAATRAIPDVDAPSPARAIPDVDTPSPVRAVDVPTPGPAMSVRDMEAAARAAAPDVDAADAAPGSYLNRMDARWNAGIERRQQRRSARQPTNIARRIVGAEQKFKPYTWGQRQSTRLGDWVGGGPGTEGSPNLFRQYVRSRLNKTDTMPEFPEGTNRALTGYERATWRNRQLMRNPNRVRRAVHAVGEVADTVEDIQDFFDMPTEGLDEMPSVSMYGDEVVGGAAPGRGFRRTNPRFAAPQQSPASQAYGQTPYTMGRGYRGT